MAGIAGRPNDDVDYQAELDVQMAYWEELKAEIQKVRPNGDEATDIVDKSEAYFAMIRRISTCTKIRSGKSREDGIEKCRRSFSKRRRSGGIFMFYDPFIICGWRKNETYSTGTTLPISSIQKNGSTVLF